jgi:hypothetical protein
MLRYTALGLLLYSATLGPLGALVGCGSVGGILYDYDGDGSMDEDDCAPADPDVFPGATVDEYGDGLDSNCDGNDGIDGDGDGYPAPGPGVTSDIEDCNDSNPGINPGSEEILNDTIDQNCDGVDGISVTGAPEVTISPLYPHTDDDLIAAVNWDFGATSLLWFVDEVEEANLASLQSVPASATVRGQVWRVVVTAVIGAETREGEASVTIINGPPLTDSVQVSPATGTVLDSFSCAGSHSDADQDALSLSYRWFVDSQVITATTSSITAGDGFARGDSLSCEITANDGIDDGLPSLSSATAQVLNSVPITASVEVSPATGGVQDTFSCTGNNTDADQDGLTLSYLWFVDSQVIAATTSSITAGDGFARDRSLTCEITAHDGIEAGLPSLSALPALVLNSPPGDPGAPSPMTASGAFTDDDLLCEAGTTATDPDADPLTYTLEWIESSAALPAVTDTLGETNVLELQLSATETSRGEQWTCRITASDGTDSSNTASSQPTAIVNSPPVTTSVQVSPASGTAFDTFSCAGSNTDADPDLLTLSYLWFVDTQPIAATSSSITSADGFERDDELTCEITAHDGIEAGSPSLSAPPAIVLNSPPSDPGMPGISHGSSALTDDDLLCEPTQLSTDPDGDDMTHTMEWIEGSASGPQVSAQFPPATAPLLQLSATETTRDEQWTCRISASDGTDVSNTITSAVTTIINSPPTAPLINTDAGPSGAVVTPLQDVACSINTVSYDADGDTLSYRMEWLEDGAPIPYENTAATANDVLTLPAASYSDDGETFTCVVTPHDGIENGPPASVSVDICGDTRISFANNSDNVHIPGLGISDYGSQGTIELWLLLRTQDFSKLFDHWTDSQADIQLRLTDQGALTSWMLHNTSGGLVFMQSPDGTIPTDAWVHIALQWDANSGSSLWVDGQQVQSSTTVMTPRDPANSSVIYLGENWARTAPYDGGFDGSVQNLRISDVVRYSSTFTPPLEFTPDNDTRVLYRLDEGGGNGSDTAANGGAAIPSAASLWQADQPCLNP